MENGDGIGMSNLEFFKYWSELAAKDPERFERERKEAVERVISKAPEDRQQRLRRLQWRIDIERARGNDPFSACLLLNRMMWDFVIAERGFLNALKLLEGDIRADTLSKKEAQILPFRKK